MNQFLFLFFLLVSTICSSQYNFDFDPSIPVFSGGNQLQLPWAGGLNYAQFSDFDYDYDGDLDLFVFDRSTNNIRVFSQESTGGVHYELVPNAKSMFPNDLIYRATMVDYDNDGKKDIFTYGIGGLKVYHNIGSAATGLQWELFQAIVYTDYPTLTTNLYVSSTDIPAIVDVDGDGDIDVLTFQLGGTHVEYHKNQSMELYGIPDSLEFVLKNECWGKFSESSTNNSVLLNDPGFPCVGGTVPTPEIKPIDNETTYLNKNYEKHTGSTLLALDVDNSGVLDLIIGDVSSTNLYMVTNGGTLVNSNSAMISVDNNYPSNTTPSVTQLFPAAYYVDLDFDAVKDLIVCPNAKNVSFNESSVQFYKNIGTNNNPNFIFTSSNFLQSEMIEHGSGSVPIIIDYDQDGLSDLLVANNYRYKPVLQKESTIAYYKNTGTSSSPAFTLIDTDVFGFASQNYGLRTIPTFGDIDNDGDQDMFIGKDDGTLMYFENTSASGTPVYAPPILNYQDNFGTIINSNGFCFPQLFDLDQDGLLDLILGEKTGNLMYFRNIGTTSTPSFELTNPTLGNIDVSTTVPNGYPTPHFFLDSNKVKLFLGNTDGDLFYYDSISSNLGNGQSFHLVGQPFNGINVEGYSSFFVNDIDNDGNLNLFVGQDLGGIFHYEANPNGSSSLIEQQRNPVNIFPNPAHTSFTIAADNANSFQLISAKGKVMLSREMNHSKEQILLNQFSQGIYFVRVQFENGITVKKLVVEK